MHQPRAELERGLQEHERAEHVGAHELGRAEDGAVDVRLRGEVHDRVDGPDLVDLLADGDVSLPALHILGEVGPVAGVGELVEDDDVLACRQHPLDEMRADETRTSCNEKPHHRTV